MRTTVDNVISKAARITLTIGMTAAVVAVPMLATVSPAMAATQVDSTISVTVEAIKVSVTQINGTMIDDSSTAAIKTLSAKNEIHFKADNDGFAQIVLGDKVLWQGEVKADQPVVATIDLTGNSVGIYKLEIRAFLSGDREHYSSTPFFLDYRATIPSIIPGGDVNAPNTGLYVTVGGRIYSMTTVATILLLVAIVVFLICSKQSKKQAVPVKAKAKTRRKMDMI